MKKSFYLALGMIVYLSYLGGCNDSSVTDKGASSVSISLTTTTLPGGPGPSGAPAPATVTLTANPATSLSAGGTANVSATVKDSTGTFVVDGTPVTFAITDPSLGSISTTATTRTGVASATFQALNVAGTETVTATAGAIVATTNITIVGANVGSIQFASALPNVIGVRGSGQKETSDVTFSVQDSNGQLVDGVTVTFFLSGPQGGETLSVTTASTKAGLAKTTIQSGTVSGPVRVNASTVVNINGVPTTISSSSTGVSIGGGIPSATHFTLAASTLNLAGVQYPDLESTVSVFLADRVGNFNVLQGTSISFYTEAGSIDRSNVTDAFGKTSVKFDTRVPVPVHYSAANPFAPLTGDPLNGFSTIIAVTRGEECFNDLNGNGIFDAGDTFPGSCDLGEPFVDDNDNGVWDPGEFYIDANKDGQYSGPNGVWDGNTLIWKKLHIAFTDGPSQMTITPGGAFTIADGGSQNFNVCVADSNASAIMGGSSVAVVASKGTLTGGGPFTLPDIIGGPYCFGFNLADTTAGDTSPPDAATLTLTVTWKVPGRGDIVATRIISGTID